MEKLLKLIQTHDLETSIKECKKQMTKILPYYLTNFPEYTDHSVVHSEKVLSYASFLISENSEQLNEDEIYILIMAGYLHDVGMCLDPEAKKELMKEKGFGTEEECVTYIRDHHHELSQEFIENNWESLKIPNSKYAQAIGRVAKGHRKADLFDQDEYIHDFTVKSGDQFVCLPYLASIVRLADELDITNDRTPELLFNKYYPQNKLSREEWEKHKANYFVNFKTERIIITAECENVNLYYGLTAQKNKIESVLKEAQKLMRILPAERNLKLGFNQIEHRLEPLGFVPKQIGFSFDLQNTLETFIGKNLYSDDLAAIRELLQNAIDTCSYKKTQNPEFTPKITVHLGNHMLSVDDNGLGMDDFIVENYFAKLNCSYYKQTQVRQTYNSIGEFGIGVFSYFLLSDYFDVETKASNKTPLKFRVTKEAGSSFYFYDDATRRNAGTKITLYLKEPLEYSKLVKEIETIFRYIDIPLTIKDDKGNTHTISKPSLREEKKDIIDKYVKIWGRKRLPEIDIIETDLDTDTYEGHIGMLVLKDGEYKLSSDSPSDIIETPYRHNYSIYQKGIYINCTDSKCLNYTTGNINLKKKLNLHLSRNQIKDKSSLDTIIKTFEKNIFPQIFSLWEDLSMEEKCEQTYLFIRHYTFYYTRELLETVQDKWIFKVYTDGQITYRSLRDLLSLSSFILVNNFSADYYQEEYSDDKIKETKEIYEEFQKPLILLFNTAVSSTLFAMLHFNKFGIQILCNAQNCFIEIIPEQTQVSPMLYERISIFPFSHDCQIGAHTLYHSTILNANHPIIGYLIKNQAKIMQDIPLKKLFEDFVYRLSYVMGTVYHKISAQIIEEINTILSATNKITGEKFEVSYSDFPEWLQPEAEKDGIST